MILKMHLIKDNVIYFCFVLLGATECLKMVQETSISDAHFLTGRLEAFPFLGTVGACASECYMDTDCVTAAYSTLTKSCQLYNLDAAHFVVGTYQQSNTYFYKVVCEQEDYTYIRALNICMKMYTIKETFDTAFETCSNDTARLIVIDTVQKMQYIKEISAHIHANTFSYYLSGYGEQNTTEYFWLFDNYATKIDEGNGGQFWGKDGPEVCSLGEDCCLVLQSDGQTIEFAPSDCSHRRMFICGIDL